MEAPVSFSWRVAPAALFGQGLMGMLLGLPGVLFASPLPAVPMVIVEELYVKDRLEKSRR